MSDYEPAPWALTGSGYIMLFKFPEAFVRDKGFVPEQLKGSFRGGLGTVMYVDYCTSNVGPYQELLFIPGRFDFSGRKYFSITRIFVSTEASVRGGRNNWGIPKETACFEKILHGDGSEEVKVSLQGRVFAEFKLRACPLSIPVTTSLVPRSIRTLAHPKDGRILLTTLESRGTAALARILQCRIDRDYFPPVDEVKPLCTVKAGSFSMIFPRAEVL